MAPTPRTLTIILAAALALSAPPEMGEAARPDPEPTVAGEARPVSVAMTPAPATERVPPHAVEEVGRGPQVVAVTRAQSDLAEAALERFETLGLGLPPDLTIYFHPAGITAPCGGYVGLATHGVEERVDLCTDAPFTLYHELGHMWAHHSLTDEQRATFVELRGLEGWRGPREPRADGRPHPHSAQGTEHAADVIAWAGLDGSVRPTGIYHNDDASLAIAFERLTGFPPPHLTPRS